MRLGVSAKVFLAYAVLLCAFAASSLFSLNYLNSAQQDLAATPQLLDVRNPVEWAFRHLLKFEQSDETGRQRFGGVWLENARSSLTGARGAVDVFLRAQPGAARRAEFAHYRLELVRLETLAAQSQGHLGRFLQGQTEPFNSHYRDLTSGVDIFLDKLGKDTLAWAVENWENGRRSRRWAVLLGLAGLVTAFGAALLTWRTLRPLHTLRVHARQIAGGDYGRRIGLRSRDEIGDLAREFDAMAKALEEREQRLIRSERLATVGKVAAQITHEIRNPLASIGLNAELLADELPPGHHEGRKLLTTISAEVDRLSEITETYLRFVRLPSPKLEREDLGALVTGVLEFARAELAHAGITLELIVAPGLPEVAADENQLRQALLNLVRNAKEALSATAAGGGAIRVSVGSTADGRVRIDVADTGPGIPAEHAAKIFDPFFSTKEKGTGLGLALVHQIVHEHGGRIEVDCPPAGGTTFSLVFPGLPASEPGQAVDRPGSAAGHADSSPCPSPRERGEGTWEHAQLRTAVVDDP